MKLTENYLEFLPIIYVQEMMWEIKRSVPC